ncbi:MAG: FadR family transcriptional regulator [Desulfatibacillum sp.]|nr:FadR family transcriptional regulator [Desulfatibacillum sp.]
MDTSRDNLFAPVKKATRTSEILTETLCRVIVEGKIKPGEFLPSERALAEKFQVNRNTVREALHSLEQMHLLSITQGSRITVQDYLTTAGFDFVAELFSSSEAGSKKLMADIGEAYWAIGRAMMQYAVDNMKATELPVIAEAVEDFAALALTADPDLKLLQDLDFEVQNRLMRSSGNQVMILLHNSIRRIYEKISGLFEPIVGSREALAQTYREIIALLEEDQREEAKQAFEKIFREGKEALSRAG